MAANKLTTIALLANRILQWSSAVIVMGITSYFIHKGLRGEHSKYTEVISTMSVVFFLPAFASIFVGGPLSLLVVGIDTIFSYLWLTAFIFAAQDYNWHSDCRDFPAGATCSKKHAQEAFVFLAFFFTFTGIFLELWSYWTGNRENLTPLHHEKRRNDAETGGAGGPPLDAPAQPTA